MAGFFAEMNKQEKLTLLAVFVFALGTMYMGWHLFLTPEAIDDGIVSESARKSGWRFFLLFSIGMFFVRTRDKSIIADERDGKIAAKGLAFGHISLVIILVLAASAISLDIDYVGSRSSGWVELFLLFAISLSLLSTSIMRIVHYWRDRQ